MSEKPTNSEIGRDGNEVLPPIETHENIIQTDTETQIELTPETTENKDKETLIADIEKGEIISKNIESIIEKAEEKKTEDNKNAEPVVNPVTAKTPSKPAEPISKKKDASTKDASEKGGGGGGNWFTNSFKWMFKWTGKAIAAPFKGAWWLTKTAGIGAVHTYKAGEKLVDLTSAEKKK